MPGRRPSTRASSSRPPRPHRAGGRSRGVPGRAWPAVRRCPTDGGGGGAYRDGAGGRGPWVRPTPWPPVWITDDHGRRRLVLDDARAEGSAMAAPLVALVTTDALAPRVAAALGAAGYRARRL